jgi:cell division transport system permease protein
MAGVSDVRYDRRWIERLLGLVGTIRTLGLGLAAILVVASCLTITAVVRLALHARRAEIEIMQLVGAPLAYIRGPFVLEGTLLGLVGGGLALLLLVGVYLGLREPLVAWAEGLVDLGDLRFLTPSLSVAIVGGGALVGCLGGLVAARSAR